MKVSSAAALLVALYASSSSVTAFAPPPTKRGMIRMQTTASRDAVDLWTPPNLVVHRKLARIGCRWTSMAESHPSMFPSAPKKKSPFLSDEQLSNAKTKLEEIKDSIKEGKLYVTLLQDAAQVVRTSMAELQEDDAAIYMEDITRISKAARDYMLYLQDMVSGISDFMFQFETGSATHNQVQEALLYIRGIEETSINSKDYLANLEKVTEAVQLDLEQADLVQTENAATESPAKTKSLSDKRKPGEPISPQYRVLGAKYMEELQEAAKDNPTALQDELEKRQVKEEEEESEEKEAKRAEKEYTEYLRIEEVEDTEEVKPAELEYMEYVLPKLEKRNAKEQENAEEAKQDDKEYMEYLLPLATAAVALPFFI